MATYGRTDGCAKLNDKKEKQHAARAIFQRNNAGFECGRDAG